MIDRKASQVGVNSLSGDHEPDHEAECAQDEIGGFELLDLLLEPVVLRRELAADDATKQISQRASEDDEDDDNEFGREARLGRPVGET